MRDWEAFVRSHLRLPDLTPEREARIVRELAAQLEDFYRSARAGGASDEEADAHARGSPTGFGWRETCGLPSGRTGGRRSRELRGHLVRATGRGNARVLRARAAPLGWIRWWR